jgi:hypothetical protein
MSRPLVRSNAKKSKPGMNNTPTCGAISSLQLVSFDFFQRGGMIMLSLFGKCFLGVSGPFHLPGFDSLTAQRWLQL